MDDTKLTQNKIAKEAGATPGMLSHLKRGRYKTLNIPLAIAVAKLTGKKPSDFLNNKIKAIAIESNPELNKKMKKSA